MKQEYNKIGQLAAYFAGKTGRINGLRLMKLLYIANRECLNRYGYPIFFDIMSCTKTSGVIMNSVRIRIMNAAYYNKYIRVDTDLMVYPLKEYTYDEFDEFSDAIIEILAYVWDRHGHQDNEELIYYMDIYNELKLYGKDVIDVSFYDILNAIGNQHADHFYSEILFYQELDEMFTKSER